MILFALLLSLPGHWNLSLQHLTYQDLHHTVATAETDAAWGRGVVSGQYKDDAFLHRRRLRLDGSGNLKRIPIRFHWQWLRQWGRSLGSSRITGEAGYLHRWGTWQIHPSFLAQRFTTPQQSQNDWGPRLRIEGPGVALHLRYTSLFQRAVLQWDRSGRVSTSVHLLDFRYPLSREREHQQEASLAVGTRWGGQETPGEVELRLTGQHQRFRWNRIRSGTQLGGFLRLEVHQGPRRLGLEIRRHRFRYLAFSGLSYDREHSLYAETRETLHGSLWEARLRVTVNRRDPPAVFAFNRRDRRVLRAETRWSAAPLPSLHLALHFVGKITDEVLLHPTRSAYTRQDQTYRFTGSIATAHWRSQTEIAALYSLYRFAPSRNLLIRYLEHRLELPQAPWQGTFRLRWQQNGTYLQDPEASRWFFLVHREMVEGHLKVRIPTGRFRGVRVGIVAEDLERQERSPGERFRRTLRELAAGFLVTGRSLSLEIQRVRRNRKPAFWAVNLSVQATW